MLLGRSCVPLRPAPPTPTILLIRENSRGSNTGNDLVGRGIRVWQRCLTFRFLRQIADAGASRLRSHAEAWDRSMFRGLDGKI